MTAKRRNFFSITANFYIHNENSRSIHFFCSNEILISEYFPIEIVGTKPLLHHPMTTPTGTPTCAANLSRDTNGLPPKRLISISTLSPLKINHDRYIFTQCTPLINIYCDYLSH